MSGGRRNDESDDEGGGWGSTFLKLAGAAAVIGGIYSVLKQPQAEVTPYGTRQPDPQVVILKVDGSLLPRKAGCGGYLSSASQKWICGFTLKLDPSLKVDETERQAILRGLKWVREKGKRKVEVKSDNFGVVDLVNSGSRSNDYVIREIRDLLCSSDWEAKLSWISGDQNKVADRLAHKAHALISFGSSGVQSNDQEHETQQFCTQGSVETINLGEEVASAPVAKTPKQRFQQKEDEVLIQSWLNVSKDSIVGVDQKGDSFWNRIGEAYNKHRDTNYKERKPMALKGRWHKINPSIQKFVGCYKQAVSTQQSGSSESNIIQAAYKIYFQDEGEKFIFEAAWRLLKDEPKWLTGSSEASTKRTKNSASGAYSSSSNPPTPTSS
ncbi:unnamed protein product [Vicia faba]|uniref:RNase H type-1 domain-containing protein n=1 Tax=Vicia faba TaxID=3906 RepID=A0AAV1A1E9_VICFA|nr:unnamed protein product [Vicia faba]CAI8604272.1 unnamed protein product [Vicia faba]